MNVKRFPNVSDYENKVVNGVLICRNCDSAVSAGRRHYCSNHCMHTFVRNHMWRYVREDVLRRDGWRCSICTKRKGRSSLDIDHIIPVRMGIDPFEKANLRTLCKECHTAKTRLEKDAFVHKP